MNIIFVIINFIIVDWILFDVIVDKYRNKYKAIKALKYVKA